MKGLNQLDIAKVKILSFSFLDLNKSDRVDLELWREFIESRKELFSWFEETEDGKKLSLNLNNFQEDFRDGVAKSLNKRQAYALYDKKRNYYKFKIEFLEKFGVVSIINIVPTSMTVNFLEALLAMANFCNAMLLVNGKKQITKEFIEKEKIEIEEKKRVKN